MEREGGRERERGTGTLFSCQVEEINLKPNGSEIDVTEENKKEYIK